MAKEYISRDDALKALEWNWAGKAAIDAVKAVPSAPVKEIIGGTWKSKGNFEHIDPTNFEMYQCTACGRWISIGELNGYPDYFINQYKFCPMCGAIMEG